MIPMFYVTDKDNITFRGHVYSPSDLDTPLTTSLEIEKTLKAFKYILISGKDESRVDAKDIREYGKFFEQETVNHTNLF